MNQLYIVKDRTDAHARKPFVKICKTESCALREVASIRNKLSPVHYGLISHEAVPVPDYDVNKNCVYVIFDKTDSHFNKPIAAMCFDYSNAMAKLNERRRGLSMAAQKLVYIRTEPVAS